MYICEAICENLYKSASQGEIFMEEEIELSRVAMHISRGCLIVPIQIELL